MKPINIVLVISSLDCGGAERVASTLANFWASEGHTVSILTLSSSADTPFFALNAKIKVYPLDLTSNSNSLWRGLVASVKRVSAIRQTLRRLPLDLIVSFSDRANVYTILASLGLTSKLIISEHSVPYTYNPGRIYRILRRCLYRFADRLVVVTPDAGRYFIQYIKSPPAVIPNPLPYNFFSDDFSIDYSVAKSELHIIGVGRFAHEKGFDLLLQAFASVQRQRSDVRLTIWGDGKLRPELEALRNQLGLEKAVSLPGFCDSPDKIYGDADLFVLSSREESLGNALIEAMAAGVPAISFDCPSGPREIIENGVSGLLVPAEDVEALAAAIIKLLNDFELRKVLGRKARESSMRFSVTNVMPMWEKLIQELF